MILNVYFNKKFKKPDDNLIRYFLKLNSFNYNFFKCSIIPFSRPVFQEYFQIRTKQAGKFRRQIRSIERWL